MITRMLAAAGMAIAAASSSQAGTAAPTATAAPPVLVELFTSQGCSSCPPADAVLERVSYRHDVVAVSRPVTYWDRLGWKDTLAREENTTLQRAYAKRGGVGAGVYTPQAMVQGGEAVVGSQLQKLEALIARAKRAPRATLAFVGRTLTIAGVANTGAQVSVMALKKRTIVAIGNGENGGRRVRYANVLLGEREIGTWRGGRAEIAIPAAAVSVTGADAYAVVVREGRAGRVLAARYLG